MIRVSLMNGSQIVLNSDMIEFVEATPDTVISLSGGKKLMVCESVDEVVERIVEFRARLGKPVRGLVQGARASQDGTEQKES